MGRRRTRVNAEKNLRVCPRPFASSSEAYEPAFACCTWPNRSAQWPATTDAHPAVALCDDRDRECRAALRPVGAAELRRVRPTGLLLAHADRGAEQRGAHDPRRLAAGERV